MSVCGIFKVVLLVLAFYATFYFDEVNARDVTSTSGFPNHPWSQLWGSMDSGSNLKISRNKRNLFGFFGSRSGSGDDRSADYERQLYFKFKDDRFGVKPRHRSGPTNFFG